MARDPQRSSPAKTSKRGRPRGASPRGDLGMHDHRSVRNTFITSSPRWLMTFTAIRPDFGLGNGREVSLCSASHASLSISAFSVVLRELYGSFAPRKYAWRTKKLSWL